MTIKLPTESGAPELYRIGEPSPFSIPKKAFDNRIAYAAAHVVRDVRNEQSRNFVDRIDWDATLSYRHHLWQYGFGIAEAMDTAQRGNGLDWTASKELIKRSLAEARTVNGLIACGAGTDHLNQDSDITVGEVINGYEEQVSFVESFGGHAIMMASRALASCARSSDDYCKVYGKVLSQVRQPVILHWLGDMFDPQLAGYWGTSDLDEATETVLEIIRENHSKIDGIKISLLSEPREVKLRRRLPESVKMYTGDDFNYDRLIWGDGRGFSHALLGVFDAIAPAAAAALNALDADDRVEYERILGPTIPLSRHIFRAPTSAYKTGLVFIAFLNGHQEHFRMLADAEKARDTMHLVELFRLADAARLFVDPSLAASRMRKFLASVGYE